LEITVCDVHSVNSIAYSQVKVEDYLLAAIGKTRLFNPLNLNRCLDFVISALGMTAGNLRGGSSGN
jgi:hypothetical protein